MRGRRRLSSIEPREYIEERGGTRGHSGQMVLVRPRSSQNDVSDYIRDLEDETGLLRLERQGGIEITRQHEADTFDNRGNGETVTEVQRTEQRGMIRFNRHIGYMHANIV